MVSIPARDRNSREPLPVTIRPLRSGDREPIRQLLIETAVFTEGEVAIALELIDIALHDPAQEDYILFTCIQDETVLGYYCIGPTPATTGTFDLYWIAAKPSVQGKGIGKKLDDHAAALVRARGGRLIIAETSSLPRYENTRRFYVRQGYVEAARITGYYRPGDDLVVYAKYLSPQSGG